MYRLRVFSPNKSCAPLREVMLKQRVLLRLGSTTPLVSKFKYLELNSIRGVKISSDKRQMKAAFDSAKIHHSEWINTSNVKKIKDFFNANKIVIVKHHHSCKGEGIYYIDNINDLNKFISSHPNISNYVFEKYYFYPQEYRLHVDVKHGCFYACKKIFKDDADVFWHKHANNSTFVLMTKEKKYPACWNDMIQDCVKAMKVIGLDIACFDVLCSNNNWIIVESNTAPSLASYGNTFYSNHLIKYYGSRF